MSDVVWQRMVLTAIHWGYKPSIPDESQSKNLVPFISMIVCTMTNMHTTTIPTDDDDKPIDNVEHPPRAPDDEQPTEGNRSNRRRRR